MELLNYLSNEILHFDTMNAYYNKLSEQILKQ